MTDIAVAAPASSPVPPPAAAPAKAGWAFTDPGCRTDVRVGALLVLVAVFLWLWFGPTTSARIYLAGCPFLLWGIPWQAIQARAGRPGYPWKLGLAMAVLGGAMWPDLRYREVPGGPIEVQIIAPLLLAAGLWIVAWWPVAVLGRGRANSVHS